MPEPAEVQATVQDLDSLLHPPLPIVYLGGYYGCILPVNPVLMLAYVVWNLLMSGQLATKVSPVFKLKP